MSSRNFRIWLSGFLMICSVHAFAGDGVTVKNEKCRLAEIKDYIQSSRYGGFDICEGMTNPSQEQNRCLEQHGNGSFEVGGRVVKARKVYNAWTSSVSLQISFAKEKISEDSLSCKEWLEVINSWSDNPKSLAYQHKQEARKLIIKDGLVKFSN